MQHNIFNLQKYVFNYLKMKGSKFKDHVREPIRTNHFSVYLQMKWD